MTVDREFFLSFTGADRPWATWLLAELDAAGYSSVSQLRDFLAGANFALDMDRAARRARRTLGVLSPRALQAPYVRQEWAQRLAGDPNGTQRALVLVRVEPCEPEGLLGPVVYIDLVGLDEASARERLREELAALVRGERLLPADPRFPGRDPATSLPEVKRPRYPTALPPVWNVPFRRNPAFTGRGQDLAELAGQLGRGAATAVTQTLQGGGGVGKTALAVEYAYRYRSQFNTVWWVRAEERTSLVGDYASLSAALDLPEAGQANQQLAAGAVRGWLEKHDRWLLILDNAEAPETPTGLPAPLARLVDLIPQVLQGQILVTSRDASWEEHAAQAELEVFSSEEAVAFLLARSGSDDHATAAEISELLGFLPLALEQAGAYMRETRLPLADYLDRLQRFPALTMTKGKPRDRDPKDTVATTWQLSLERVRPTLGAVALLEVCAFLGPEEIPRELFSGQLDLPMEEFNGLANDPFALDEAVAALRRFGLVKADEQALTVHRLLQQVIRDNLDPVTKAARVDIAVRLMLGALPENTGDKREEKGVTWLSSGRLLPHAIAAADHGEGLLLEHKNTVSLLNRVASHLWFRAQYQQASELAERARAIGEAKLGQDHPEVARSLDLRGAALHQLGDLHQARSDLEQAVAIREAMLGRDHPDVATSLNRVGTLLVTLAELPAAKAALERALEIRRSKLGPDDPEVAWSLYSLAAVQRDLGNLPAAQALLERAVAINEYRFGPAHFTVARNLNRLGTVRLLLDSLHAARADFGRALEINEAQLGSDHPQVARSLNGLGAVLRELGELRTARTLHERALTIHETRLGPDHTATARSLNSLGLVLHALGDLDAARTLFERAVGIYESRLGPDHPDTAWSLSNLGAVLHDQSNLDTARVLHERALAIREARLGRDHPDTVRSRQALAVVVSELGNQQ